jgi:hypothetical protein
MLFDQSTSRDCEHKHGKFLWRNVYSVIITTVLTVTEYLCHEYLPFVSHNSILLSSLMTYHHILSKSYTTGVTSGAVTAYPYGVPAFISDFL